MKKEVFRKSQQPNVENKWLEIKNSFHDSIILLFCYSITQIINQSINRKSRLRNPSTQTPSNPGTEPDLFLGRGYTGHEHLTWFGLINMNARLYDPAVGRFLSPDNYVQDPTNSQNFNRYSYCLNNPLKYVDLSGEAYYYKDSDGKWKWERDATKGNPNINNNNNDYFGYNFNNQYNTGGGWGGHGSANNIAYNNMWQNLTNPSKWLSGTNMLIFNIKTDGGLYTWGQYGYMTGGIWDGDKCYDPGTFHLISYKIYLPQGNAISRHENQQRKDPNQQNEKLPHGIHWESEESNDTGGPRGILDGPARDIGIGLPGKIFRDRDRNRNGCLIVAEGKTPNGNNYIVIDLLAHKPEFTHTVHDSIVYNKDGSYYVYVSFNNRLTYLYDNSFNRRGKAKK